MKKLAIMQPYFFPYIGYFQLIRAVDTFVIYDNIQYSKKGWVNRNRILRQGKEALISIPLKKDSDFLDIRDRRLAAGFRRERLLNQISDAYRRAPYFAEAFPIVETVLRHDDDNLFRFLYHSIISVCEYLQVDTDIATSSAIPIDHALRGQDKVLAICEQAAASHYINPIGGVPLYSREDFMHRDIQLQFLRTLPCLYPQMDKPFVPSLSIIDVMMFNSVRKIGHFLNAYHEVL